MSEILSGAALAAVQTAVETVLERECLCENKPLYPTEQEYNPACPCHEPT